MDGSINKTFESELEQKSIHDIGITYTMQGMTVYVQIHLHYDEDVADLDKDFRGATHLIL